MRDMPDLKSAEAIDAVLERFRGDKTVIKTELEKEYANDKSKYFETENHLDTLDDDGLIKINKYPGRYVLTPRGKTVISKMWAWGYTAMYNEKVKKLLDEENKKHSAISVADVKGSVFVHSPVSESIISTIVEPTVTPKKKMSITKIIAIVSGIITIMLGLYFLYDRYLK